MNGHHYSPDLNHLDFLLHLEYPAAFRDTKADDFRLQLYRTSKRQSNTSGRRAPFRQFENKLAYTMRKKQLNVLRKQNGDAIQHIFH